MLEAFFKKYSFDHIHNTDYQIGNGVPLFGELLSKGYEGVIAKSPESIYLSGKRSDSWLKIKSTMMPFYKYAKIFLSKGKTSMVKTGTGL